MIPKKNRLPTSEIRQVMRQTRPTSVSPLRIFVNFTKLTESRFAITIPKKVVSQAVGRNRWKRIISESVSQMLPLPKSIDAVLVLTKDMPNYKTQDITHVLQEYFRNISKT